MNRFLQGSKSLLRVSGVPVLSAVKPRLFVARSLRARRSRDRFGPSLPADNLNEELVKAEYAVREMVIKAEEIAKRRMSSDKSGPSLRADNLNEKLVKAEYAVRGEMVIKAEEIAKRLEQKDSTLNFKEIISCNIGNPHDLGQKPITFFRQVLALCHYPALLDDPSTSKGFPADAQARARAYLKAMKGGTGAYSPSQGLKIFREEAAKFIADRDGYASDADNIFLTGGASVAVRILITAMIRDSNDGVMVPIPQYPLYSATLTLQGGSCVGYPLDEKAGWGLQLPELEKSLKEAKDKGINVRAMVVINPGNPTGQCLPADNMKDVVDFCHKNNILLMADEVYQTNIYAKTPFTSFKKVLRDMGDDYSNFQLASLHSVSKGFLGECGHRGGYMELVGFDPAVKQQIYKLASISLCPNTSGQIMIGLMCNPPQSGDASYELYAKERDSQLESLKRRAAKLAKALNDTEGVTCNPIEGAMYAFPQVHLPPKAVAAATAAGKSPDTFYCLALLEETGIVVVPGSGFGQAPGTFHFRTTILPLEDKMDEVASRFKAFHAAFLAKYK